MPTKVFVGHMTIGTQSYELEELFRPFGEISECVALGVGNYGFVHMLNEEDAENAIRQLHNSTFNGSVITVEKSTKATQGRITKVGDNNELAFGSVELKSKKIPNRNTTKIFVGNVPPSVSSEELRILFEDYGTVTEADSCGGFGFVHMKNKEEAMRAISSLKGMVLYGSPLTVELSTKDTQGRWSDPNVIPKRNTTKIFVGNLPPNVPGEELRALFEQFGSVTEADTCGAFGFVHMADRAEAVTAVESLKDYYLHGSILTVELSTPKSQGRLSSLDSSEDRMPQWGSRGRGAAGARGGGLGRIRGRGAGSMRGWKGRYNPYGGLSIGESDEYYDEHYEEYPPRSMRGGRGLGRGLSQPRLFPSAHVQYVAPQSMYGFVPEPVVQAQPAPSDSFARDLLKLYTQDPVAFDHFAKNPLVRREFAIDNDADSIAQSVPVRSAAYGVEPVRFPMSNPLGFGRLSQNQGSVGGYVASAPRSNLYTSFQ